MTDQLFQRVRRLLREAGLGPGGRVVAGFSGGVDSLVLLHLLQQLHARQAGPEPLALHVDHGLRPESAADAERACERAREVGVPCRVTVVDVARWGAAAIGVEAAARAARYAALADEVRRVEAAAVAMGHNRDDQAETVLLRLLRGAGLEGLAAMRTVSRRAVPRSPGGEPIELAIVRPLLETPRAEIAGYAAAHGLRPVEDPSNAEAAFRRNRVRHELLPLAEALAPGARATIARTAGLLADDAALLTQLAAEAVATVLRQDGAALLLSREPLLALPLALQRRVLLRAWARQDAASEPSFERVEALRVALQRGVPATIELSGGLTARVDHSGARLLRVGKESLGGEQDS
ncbi:MAG TPA: tRNA lysidine(34) synthetase TilS [Thermomicrobiaceae bacterium]|nr:tRNA lysidine(34) synthetase TilS [Thermomicrobiaceae bacterium]